MQIHAHNKKDQLQSTCYTHLTLYGQPLEKVNTYKYLGLLLSSDLSWTQHINNTCTKAKKLLGLMYRRFYHFSTPASLFQMYISLVRPNLEYASQVWARLTWWNFYKMQIIFKAITGSSSHAFCWVTLVSSLSLQSRERYLLWYAKVPYVTWQRELPRVSSTIKQLRLLKGQEYTSPPKADHT